SSTSSPLLYLALLSFFSFFCAPRELHSFPTRRSSDLTAESPMITALLFITFAVLMLIGTSVGVALGVAGTLSIVLTNLDTNWYRSEEHTSELQSRENLVCRLLLEKKKKTNHDERKCRG